MAPNGELVFSVEDERHQMTDPTKARSLELFFVDGTPEGMLTAKIPFQWTGHVLVAARTRLIDALKR